MTGFNPNGATVTDANGVSPDFSGLAQFDLGLDVNAATVTDVTASPSTGEADSGQQVLLTLAMSEAVTVNTAGGSPTLYLSDGAIATYDSAASNPSAGTLVFDYTVGATDEDPDLQIAQVNLNGATINDANGHAADLSGAQPFCDEPADRPGLCQFGDAIGDRRDHPRPNGAVDCGDERGADAQPRSTVCRRSRSTTAPPRPTTPPTSDPAAGTLIFDYTVGTNQQTANLEVTSVNFPSAPTDAEWHSANFADALNISLGLSIGDAAAADIGALPRTRTWAPSMSAAAERWR